MPAKNEVTAAPEAAEKTAAELLIEMQLEEKRKASINPMVVTEVVETDGKEKNEAGSVIVSRSVYANGAVLENYA